MKQTFTTVSQNHSFSFLSWQDWRLIADGVTTVEYLSEPAAIWIFVVDFLQYVPSLRAMTEWPLEKEPVGRGQDPVSCLQ